MAHYQITARIGRQTPDGGWTIDKHFEFFGPEATLAEIAEWSQSLGDRPGSRLDASINEVVEVGDASRSHS